MERITVAEYSEFRKKYVKKLKTASSFLMVCFIAAIATFIACFFSESLILRIVSLMFVIGYLVIAYTVTEMQLKGSKEKEAIKAMEMLKADPISDSTLGYLDGLARKTAQMSTKVYIATLISEMYSLRGEFDSALNILNMTDGNFLTYNDDMAIAVYSDIISVYAEIKDRQSAERAYSEILPALERNRRTKSYIVFRAMTSIQCDMDMFGGITPEYEKLAELVFQDEMKEKSLKAQPHNILNRLLFVSSYITLAEVKKELGKKSEAMECLKKAEKYAGSFTYQKSRYDALMSELSEFSE